MKNVLAKGSFIVLTLLFAAAFGLFAAWRMKQPRPADAAAGIGTAAVFKTRLRPGMQEEFRPVI